MKNKIFKSTFAISILLIVISIFNKGIAFFREVLYAKNFGMGTEFNAFLVSSILPITIYSTIYYLTQFYFVPRYNKVLVENKVEVKKFLSDNFWIFFFIGMLITLILYLLSNTIINLYLGNIEEEIKLLSLNLFKIYIFTIPLSAAHSILSAYLNAESKFIYPALSIILLNLTIVFALLFFVRQFNIYIIPIAFVIGMLLQLIFLLYNCRNKINFNPLSILHSSSFSNVFNFTLLLTLLTEVISLTYVIIDRYFLDRLGDGGVAALSYSYQLFELPIKIFTFAIATIVFSKLSKSFRTLPREVLENQFQTGIKLAIFIFTPITLLYFFWGDALIKILYERGRFTANDTILTFKILKLYTLGIVFYSAYAIVNKMIYSAGLLKSILLITICGAIVKIVLSFLFVDKYQQAGLAITTSISYGIICISGFIIIYKTQKFTSKYYPIKSFFIYILLGMVCAFLTYIIQITILESSSLTRYTSPFLFVLFYTITLLFINTEEVILIKDYIRKSFK